MMIPAERKRLGQAATAWAIGILLGIPQTHPLWLAPIWTPLALIYWAVAAVELYILTDPIWRIRQRAAFALGLIAKALAGLGDSSKLSTAELARLAKQLERLNAHVSLRAG